ncbi:OmpP1/FadL family transporter [soil metagenome]
MAQLDNLANVSAEWVRTPARNAATDAGDIVVYNPAGLVRLSEGFTINIGNQSLFRKPTHSYDMGFGMGQQTFTQDGADPFLPNLYASYHKENWAIFTGIFMSGGGATLNYPTGSITTDMIGLQVLSAAQGAYGMAENQHIKASSMYLTSTIGVSYALTDRVSVAAAGRFTDAKNKTQGGMTFTQSPVGLPDAPYALNTEDNATGFGGVISMMMKATPRLDLTIRYESAVKLDFKTTTKQDDFGATVDGSKSRRDLPAVLAFGGAYAAGNSIKIYGDLNYYFQKNANWDNSTMATNESSWSEMAGDAATYALATTIQTSPKMMLSIGGAYTDFMYANKEGYYTKTGAYETIPDDNVNVNIGGSYKITNALSMTLAYMHIFYKDQTINAALMQPMVVPVKVSNKADVFAIGLNLQF